MARLSVGSLDDNDLANIEELYQVHHLSCQEIADKYELHLYDVQRMSEHWPRLLPPEADELTHASMKQAVGKGTDKKGQYLLRRRNGQHQVIISLDRYLELVRK